MYRKYNYLKTVFVDEKINDKSIHSAKYSKYIAMIATIIIIIITSIRRYKKYCWCGSIVNLKDASFQHVIPMNMDCIIRMLSDLEETSEYCVKRICWT